MILKKANLIDVRIRRIVIVSRISSERFFFEHRLVQRVQDLQTGLARKNVVGQDGVAIEQIRSEISGWKQNYFMQFDETNFFFFCCLFSINRR